MCLLFSHIAVASHYSPKLHLHKPALRLQPLGFLSQSTGPTPCSPSSQHAVYPSCLPYCSLCSVCLPEGIQDLSQGPPHQEALVITIVPVSYIIINIHDASHSALHGCCLHIYGLCPIRLSGPRGQGSGHMKHFLLSTVPCIE